MDDRSPTPRDHRDLRLAVALGVLAGTTAVALEGVPRWEAELFARINGLPHALEPALWAPMQLGSLVGPVVVGAGARLATGRWEPAVGTVVCGVTAWQAAKVVKELIRRERPKDVLERVVLRRGTPVDGLGFVSGHTAVAAACATVLSPSLPAPARWAAYGATAVVAVARIHVAAHLPLDTVGGAALGVAIADGYRRATGSRARRRRSREALGAPV